VPHIYDFVILEKVPKKQGSFKKSHFDI
jgi:hypothetical protein